MFINIYRLPLHHVQLKSWRQTANKIMTQYFNNKYLLKFLEIVSWIIFVGLCVEASALLVNFVISLFKPEIISRLYQKLDLMNVYEQSQWAYYCTYSAIIAIAVMKAYLFYVVIMLVWKLDLDNPFSTFVADKISTISHVIFSIGIVSYVTRSSIEKLLGESYDINDMSGFFVDNQAFIVMAAIIYIIAVIFKRGIELQNENDLTV